MINSLDVISFYTESVGNFIQVFSVGYSVVSDTFFGGLVYVVFITHDSPDVARLNFLATCKFALMVLGNLVLGHAATRQKRFFRPSDPDADAILAPLATPAIVWLLAGESIEVDVVKMFLDIVKIVIAPIVVGVAINELLPRFAARIRRAMPAFSALVVAVIVLGVVAASAGRIREAAALVALAVVLHNGLGLALGWGAGRLFRMDASRRRTLAIEVGMQNSGLAVSLAAMHFASMPLAAVPGALFSVWHNVSGALFASLCARRARGGAA